MNVRIAAAGVLLLVILGLPAAAQKEKAKVYKTPQEVFDAFLTATNKRDARGFVSCLSPEAIKDMAGSRAVAVLDLRARVMAGDKEGKRDEKLVKRFKGLFGVLDRHGLTERAARDIKPETTPQAQEKAAAAAVELMKDPAAFLADLLVEDDRLGSGKDEKMDAKLTRVQGDGDRRRGTVALTEAGKPREMTFEFVKVGDGWKLNPRPKEKGAPKGKDARKKD